MVYMVYILSSCIYVLCTLFIGFVSINVLFVELGIAINQFRNYNKTVHMNN